MIADANRDLNERRASTLEQAALRRVAALVAQGVQSQELFAVVAEEVGRVVDAPSVEVARYESDGTATVCGTFPSPGASFRTGTRVSLEGGDVLALVREHAEPARVDSYAELEGEIAEAARRSGMCSSVGVPLMVAGRVWGAIVASDAEGLPENTGSRLAEFTELLAAAIANTESREALARLADEQVALLRLATLVTGAVPPHEIFSAVSDEVAQLFASSGLVLRFEEDGLGIVSVGVSTGNDIPVGTRWEFEEGMASLEVYRTGSSARVDAFDWSSGSGPAAETAGRIGIVSSVSNPILVQNRLWGAITVLSTSERLSDETEDRLEKFSQLVATAIANAESRDAVSRARHALERVAAEQAALGRVATLVAQDAAPAEIFAAVSAEVDRVFHLDPATFDVAGVVRFEPGPELVVVGVSKDVEAVPLGSHFPPEELFAPTHVLRTGRSARIGADDLEASGTEVAEFLRHHGYLSQVASPILVDGRLWGAISLNSRNDFPPDTEQRLERFTELVATAIANAESRGTLAQLADEQAALRRVATLVAKEDLPETVFARVAEETGRLLGGVECTLLRSDRDGAATNVGTWGEKISAVFPLETRFFPDGDGVAATVLRTGRPHRIDDYSAVADPIARSARDRGIESSVGCPILVRGAIWGAIVVGTTGAEPFPPETEMRLTQFADLVATAVANAEARGEIGRLADEQAALRRVATLVARDASPGEVFNAVAKEVGTLLDTDITVVGRYDGDGSATATGSWSASPGGVPVGTRSAVGGHNVLTLVAETEKPARVEGYDGASGEAAEIARRHGWLSSIAAPIIVEGRLWGVMLVATQRPEPFPAGAEERLAAFTDLVATALANAQAHDEVRRFGEEQAALGRVATLVAAGAAPEQVFTAVVEEASSLLGLELIEFVRYDGSKTGTVIAASGQHPFPPGSTWSLDDPSVMATVARTARPARMDDYGAMEGEIARVARSAGFQSAIGAPLTVEGRLWGVIIAISTDPEPIPERSEARLGQFTELVATAVANAEARQALERVAAEQATLRRIATLVAQGVQPEELFAAVAEETAATFDAITALMRFEHDPPGVVLVGVSKETGLPIGTRWHFVEGMASAEVYRTGRPARFSSGADYWSLRGGPVAEAGGRLGIVSQVSCPIAVEGGVWGVITVNGGEELPPDTEQRLEKFTDLVSTAIANAEGKSELAASRRRIVAAGDEARRRIERDLHDGIQQRLIALTFRARAMTRRPPDELPQIAAELSEGLKDVSDELREVSRGIHPTILTEAGLGPALRALARRSDVPVDVDVRLDERLPAPVEAAAYYIASEALTNVAKHAHANVVQLTAAHDNGLLTLEVRDDGIGGLDATRGSGILGLTDRAEALAGTISITSPPHGGTTLSVRLPTTT